MARVRTMTGSLRVDRVEYEPIGPIPPELPSTASPTFFDPTISPPTKIVTYSFDKEGAEIKIGTFVWPVQSCAINVMRNHFGSSIAVEAVAVLWVAAEAIARDPGLDRVLTDLPSLSGTDIVIRNGGREFVIEKAIIKRTDREYDPLIHTIQLTVFIEGRQAYVTSDPDSLPLHVPKPKPVRIIWQEKVFKRYRRVFEDGER